MEPSDFQRGDSSLRHHRQMDARDVVVADLVCEVVVMAFVENNAVIKLRRDLIVSLLMLPRLVMREQPHALSDWAVELTKQVRQEVRDLRIARRVRRHSHAKTRKVFQVISELTAYPVLFGYYVNFGVQFSNLNA